MIRELPNFIGKLKSLRILGLSKDGSYHPDGSSSLEDSVWQLPNGINMLENLKELDLSKCDGMKELASLSHLEELTLGDLDLNTLGQLPSSPLSLELHFCSIRWAELTTLLFGCGEVEDIPLDKFPQLENLTIYGCKLLQTLSFPSELRKLRQASVSSCPELVEVGIAGLSKSLESFSVYGCESLSRISGLSYLKNLEKLEIEFCNALTTVEGINGLESLKSLKVKLCKSLARLIDASFHLYIPDNCLVHILRCGEFIDSSKYPSAISLKCYIDEILQDTSNKMEHPFTIEFFLRIKQFSRVNPVQWRKKKDVSPDSVTYEGLIADVKSFDFVMKRMWYKTSDEDGELRIEIESNEQVKGMVQLASKRGSIRLIVEGELKTDRTGVVGPDVLQIQEGILQKQAGSGIASSSRNSKGFERDVKKQRFDLLPLPPPFAFRRTTMAGDDISMASSDPKRSEDGQR
ncbi:hypothetical protein NL676_033764 [Syzygium grande]|nr:hypothetical protein NL676_033764 [Syzygium grande]